MLTDSHITKAPLKALGQLSKTAINNLGKGSDHLIGLLTIAFIFAIIIIVIIGAALISENTLWYWILGVSCFVIVGLSTAIIAMSRSIEKNNKNAEIHWKRIVIDPASITNCQQSISEKLRGIRERVHHLLMDEYKQIINRKYIRANIFFPNEIGKGGCAYQLIRPVAFKDTDLEKDDDSFVLPPNLGSTGWVFNRGIPNITNNRLNRLPNWRSKVDKKLKWIITLPIISNSRNAPFGVLNIDGIYEDVKEEFLNNISNDDRISELIKSIAEDINKLPKIEIVISSNKNQTK